MRFGFVGPSYTASSVAVADEEAINWYAETSETQGSVSPGKSYGGQIAQGLRSYVPTPGLAPFAILPESPVRGSKIINGRLFVVAGTQLCEVVSSSAVTPLQTIANDGKPVSIAASTVELLIVSAGSAYCYTVATNTLTDVTSLLAGVPGVVWYSDAYFVLNILDTNKYQFSDILDGTTWPGLNVNGVSVFPENLTSLIVNHREIWVMGGQHIQPYQNTGSSDVFDVIPGALIETGNGPLFAPCLIDNSVFWIGQDERGARVAQRSNGYTPVRVSTHAVEIDLQSYSEDQIANLVTYSYQDAGHLFWVLYVPNSSWSWVYDLNESLWHKRDHWINNIGPSEPHHSWNHVYAFGKHLVGDWSSNNLWEMHLPINNNDGSYSFVSDNGNVIRRVRRAPTVRDEKKWLIHTQMIVDFDAGMGPQPPLTDEDTGEPREPQAMLRWSNDSGHTWSNEHWRDCGFAGEYGKRVFWLRLGRSRNRVYELVVTDPVIWTIVDAYLEVTE